MIEIFVLMFISLMIFLFYIFFIRFPQVASFRISYLREESNFLMRTMWIDDKGGIFARFDALPSFNLMIWKFWIPMRKFDRPLSVFYDMSKVKDIYTDSEVLSIRNNLKEIMGEFK